MSWSEVSNVATTWSSNNNQIVLNRRFTTYDVSGLSYDTSGISYDWYIENVSNNADYVWDPYSDVSTSWSSVSDTTPAVVLTITAGSSMGLLLGLTYAETITTVISPESGPGTTSWSEQQNISTVWS